MNPTSNSETQRHKMSCHDKIKPNTPCSDLSLFTDLTVNPSVKKGAQKTAKKGP